MSIKYLSYWILVWIHSFKVIMVLYIYTSADIISLEHINTHKYSLIIHTGFHDIVCFSSFIVVQWQNSQRPLPSFMPTPLQCYSLFFFFLLLRGRELSTPWLWAWPCDLLWPTYISKEIQEAGEKSALSLLLLLSGILRPSYEETKEYSAGGMRNHVEQRWASTDRRPTSSHESETFLNLQRQPNWPTPEEPYQLLQLTKRITRYIKCFLF